MIRTKTLRSHLSYFHWFPIDIHFHFEFLKLVFGSLQGITCPFFLQPPSALQPEISALLQFSCGTGLSSTLYVRKRCLQLSGLQNSPSPFFLLPFYSLKPILYTRCAARISPGYMRKEHNLLPSKTDLTALVTLWVANQYWPVLW